MKRILFSIFALCGALCMNAQVVSNVRAMQQDTTLVIVYDLSASATTKLQVSFDGGATFKDAKSVSGEIGAQQAGTNRIAYWNAVKDAGFFDCSQMVFKVIASNIKNQPQPIQMATTNEILHYQKGKVFKDYQDISKGYRYFLKNNSPEAFKVYKKKWHGMFWAGFCTYFFATPVLIGTSFLQWGSTSPTKYADWGVQLGFGMMTGITGISLMCASTSYARKHSVKAFNEYYGANPYALAPEKKTPVELRFGTNNNGLGMSLHF